MPKLKSPKRSKISHKGNSGKVLVIGGSVDYHGAPILSSLAALRSGVDLVYLLVPSVQAAAAKRRSLDLIVGEYPAKYFDQQALKIALKLAEEVDAVLIGPGLGKGASKAALKQFFTKLKKPLVIDADAILEKGIELKYASEKLIFTPHAGEFKRLTGKQASASNLLKSVAKLQATILLKGPVDLIASHGTKRVYENHTGNAAMTVGGTGDILAGLTVGFLAQGLSTLAAARLAADVNGQAGEWVYKEKGNSLIASDLLGEIVAGNS